MGVDSPVDIVEGYKTTIALEMVKTMDAQGKIVWRNMGAKYDKYSTSFTFYTDNATAKLVEQNMKNHSLISAVTPTDTQNFYHSITSGGGFWLFSPYFQDTQEIEFAVTDQSTTSNFDFFGKLTGFNFTVIPRYRDIYSNLTLSPAINSGCFPDTQGIQIGTVWLGSPDGKFTTKINQNNTSIELHGDYSETVHFERSYGESFKCKYTLDEEKVRQLIAFFVTNRSAQFDVVVNDGYYPFGKDYDSGSYKCVLADNILKINHKNHTQCEITFSIQVKSKNA
jgi:hypothetical protein